MHDQTPPLVTVVSPSLNQGPYIARAIDSVLGQGYPRLEYIVVDGGSTDGTLDTLRSYGDRLRWVSEADSGQSAAVNKGFALGSGPILGWLNSDDYYEEGAVARAVRLFQEHPGVMLVYGEAGYVGPDGRDLGPCDQVEPFDLERLVHYGDILVQPAAFLRREAFEAVGGLDESLHWAMDYDLWLKVGRRFEVLHVPERLAWYRLTGENKTLRGGRARLDEIAAVARRHGSDGLPAAFRVEQLAAAWRDVPRLFREGRAGEALRRLGQAMRAVLSSARSRHALVALTMARLARPRPGRGRGDLRPS